MSNRGWRACQEILHIWHRAASRASNRIAGVGLVLATTFGLVIWVVLWALGYSGLDSGLLALVAMLLGASGRIALRYLPGGGGHGADH